jgi:hypothetical protein
MIQATAEDVDTADRITSRLERQEIVATLFGLRCAKNLSQGDVASHMKCSQSRISKMERSFDEDLRFGDVAAYLDALGMDLRVSITKKSHTALDEVKFHAYSIKRIMDELVAMAADNEQKASTLTFIKNAAWNLGNLLRQSASLLALPQHPHQGPRISVETDDDCQPDNESCNQCGCTP